MKNNLKLHLWISHLIMIVGVVLAIAGVILNQGNEGVHYLVWVAVAVVFGSVLYKAFTLKCPHCGAFLPAKYKLPDTCPNCNKSVFEEEITHEEADA